MPIYESLNLPCTPAQETVLLPLRNKSRNTPQQRVNDIVPVFCRGGGGGTWTRTRLSHDCRSNFERPRFPWMFHYRCTAIAPLSHDCHPTVTRLSHDCHTTVTRLPRLSHVHDSHTTVTRLSRLSHDWCMTVARLSHDCHHCRTIVAQLLACCTTISF